MARYIKANPLVAKFLNLENDRNTVKDGNYILWQGDVLPFGPLTQLGATLAAIGAIALMPHEAREEQDGTQTRPLPEATDPRFIMPTIEAPTEEAEEPGTAEPSGDAESENPDAPENGDTTAADADSEDNETNTDNN